MIFLLLKFNQFKHIGLLKYVLSEVDVLEIHGFHFCTGMLNLVATYIVKITVLYSKVFIDTFVCTKAQNVILQHIKCWHVNLYD